MSCMSGSPNLNRFRDRGQVAVQLVSCGVLLPGLNRRAICIICMDKWSLSQQRDVRFAYGI